MAGHTVCTIAPTIWNAAPSTPPMTPATWATKAPIWASTGITVASSRPTKGATVATTCKNARPMFPSAGSSVPVMNPQKPEMTGCADLNASDSACAAGAMPSEIAPTAWPTASRKPFDVAIM